MEVNFSIYNSLVFFFFVIHSSLFEIYLKIFFLLKVFMMRLLFFVLFFLISCLCDK